MRFRELSLSPGDYVLLCVFFFTFCLLLLGQEAHAQRGLDLENDTLTQSVLIHPPIDATENGLSLTNSEHTYQSLLGLGDQLGTDFKLEKTYRDGDGVTRHYKPGTDGKENEDWHAWRQEVLAPFEATVAAITYPDTVNVPGEMNRDAQPGRILFEDHEEGITVLYAHVREIQVEEGETVRPGEVVAKVGNNGTSRAPHLHVGAWEGNPSKIGEETGTPLQIQVDLYAEERFGNTNDQ